MFNYGFNLGIYAEQLKLFKSGLLSLLSPSTVSVSPGAIADTSVATAGSAGMALDDINNTATVVDGSNSLVYGYNINSDGTFQLAGSISTNGLYPGRISISPNGNNAYISTTSGAAGVECYSRNTGNGTVSLLGIILGYHANTQIVVISPNNDFMYISDAGTGYIYTYSGIDTNATLINSISVGSGATGITISPDGLSVYVTNSSNNTVPEYSRNTSTGVLTFIGNVNTGVGPQVISISPDSNNAYVCVAGTNTLSEYSRNTSTGLLTSIGTIATDINPYGIAISPDGLSVYVSNWSGNNISEYSRNTSTGLLSVLQQYVNATISTNITLTAMVISTDNLSLYTTNSGSNNISEFSINTSTGLLSNLSTSTITTGSIPSAIVMSIDNNNVYVTNSNSSSISQYLRS